MPNEITYLDDLGTVVITYVGQAPPAEVHDAIKQAYDMALERKSKRFLVDCTQMEPGGGSITDIYELVNLFEQFPNIRQYKDAIILPPIPAGIDDLKFFETAARNRGFSVRVFTDRQAAIDWLLE